MRPSRSCASRTMRSTSVGDGDIGDDRGRAHAERGDLALGIAQPVFAARDERDVAALRRERARDRAADAARGAGDEGGFAGELEIHWVFRVLSACQVGATLAPVPLHDVEMRGLRSSFTDC